MYISRRFAVLPLIVAFFVFFLYLDAAPQGNIGSIGALALLIVTTVITLLLLRWVENGNPLTKVDRRQRRLDKMLTRMNDDELEFLRERLSDQTYDGEYESLESLLQEKQKRST